MAIHADQPIAVVDKHRLAIEKIVVYGQHLPLRDGFDRRPARHRDVESGMWRARFAVKEAAAKALGTGIRNGLAFNQFEVYNDELGKPKLRLWGEAKSLAERLGVSSIHVTLADERHYACATVIIES